MPRRISSDMYFFVGGQLLDSISVEDALGADDEGIDRTGGEIGPGTQNQQVCGGQALMLFENREYMLIRTRTGLHNLPSENKFKILGYTFNQAWKMQDSLEERMQSAKQSLVERCEDLQRQRCTM